ncbi:caspase-2-like isoform X2 [Thrips palmi]|uniref:Caspase-2-like isoform X2 n=1 Tax=Thrips palmi TaxID=161013 RepID=A0A6P8YX22_THRPL|nr:caspase-2-like isoform X2 [Thrips palmi]
MDEKDRQTLNDNLSKLSVNCNFDYVLGCLENLFTERQLQMYRSESFMKKTEELKCQSLFEDIQTRGPNAFKDLLQCFKNTGHLTQYMILTGFHSGKTDTESRDEQEKVKKSRTIQRPSQSVYKMTSDPRGYFIFINNIKFQKLDERKGAHLDRAFGNLLIDMGYVGTYHQNQTKKDMRRLLKEFAAKEDLSTVDSLIVAISSHGKVNDSMELMICSSDDLDESDPILVNEVISLFDCCKLPQGQPKIFCINACRDDKDGRTEIIHRRNMWLDTFFLAPCFEGTTANRFEEYGSWLFMALIEVFKEHACDKDLDQMKNLINDKFEEYYHHSHKIQTLSFYKYGVSKRLFFNPGLYDQGAAAAS